MSLPPLRIPPSLNYIGVFLSFRCTLACTYCINDPMQRPDRYAVFRRRDGLHPEQWIEALNRFPQSDDLPITLQGGEPMIYRGGKGAGQIIAGVDHWFDLLTNFAMRTEDFVRSLQGHQKKLRRGSLLKQPAQAVRVSYHPVEMNRIWGNGMAELLRRIEGLRAFGFRVSRDKFDTDVCINMVEHPDNLLPEVDADVLVDTKPFLGTHNGVLYGDYRYQHSTDLVSSGLWHSGLECECRTTELLIDPLGWVYDCHYHLYAAWLGQKQYVPVGNILDSAFSLAHFHEWHACSDYGKCIGCDVKLKNDRHQSLEFRGIAHTGVEIRNIRWPKKLKQAEQVEA